MWVSRGGYGRVGVAWWVWVLCGSVRWVLPLSCGGGVTAWVAARFQALTSRFGTTIESQQHTNANINYLKFKINYLYMISYNSN